MAIENRDLPAGTRLVANYKKARYVCVVETDEEGKLAFVLEDGKRYKSPSSAASAVMAGSAANGWKFWTIQGEEATPPADAADSAPRQRARARKPAPGTEAPQPQAADYEIDADGRPIYRDETQSEGTPTEA